MASPLESVASISLFLELGHTCFIYTANTWVTSNELIVDKDRLPWHLFSLAFTVGVYMSISSETEKIDIPTNFKLISGLVRPRNARVRHWSDL